MKALLVLLVLSIAQPALARQILVEKDGLQELKEVGATGAVKGTVLWDELLHGPLASLPGEVGSLEAYDAQEPALDEQGRPIYEPLKDAFGEPLLDQNGQPVLSQKMKLVRKLRVNQDKRAALEVKKAEKAAQEKAKEDARKNLLALKAKVKGKTATAAEVRELLAYILEKLGE